MIPKTQTQAVAGLIDRIGDAIKQYAYDLQGLDPQQVPADHDKQEAKPSRVSEIETRAIKKAAEKAKRLPLPETNAEWRKFFIANGIREFDIYSLGEKFGYTKQSSRTSSVKARMLEPAIALPEVTMIEPHLSGRYGHPARYLFDPMALQPASEEAPATPKKEEEYIPMHPARLGNPKRPKTGNRLSQRWVNLAWEQGWMVSRTGGNHLKFAPPSGDGLVLVSSTPSDYRADMQIRKDLERVGLKV